MSTFKRILIVMFEKQRKRIKSLFSFKKQLAGVNVWNESGAKLDPSTPVPSSADKVRYWCGRIVDLVVI